MLRRKREKKMKNKLEQKLDKEFKKMGIKPYIHHFMQEVPPFAGFTIATLNQTTYLMILHRIQNSIWRYTALTECFNPASKLLIRLAIDDNLHGVSICDRRDQYSKKRGRIIAKGRLLKHLKGRARNDI